MRHKTASLEKLLTVLGEDASPMIQEIRRITSQTAAASHISGLYAKYGEDAEKMRSAIAEFAAKE